MQRKVAVLVLATFLGAGGGGAWAYLARGSSPAVVPSRPALAWPANHRRAPSFELRDQLGRPVSVSALLGRPAIVTFIDPLCRDLCPLEAQVLARVTRDLGSRAPALVAVSVNPPADTRANLREDARAWRLPPAWRWALGSPSALARAWHDYGIGVRVTPKTLAGVTVRLVSHTEAAYVIDSRGYERALFVYPFAAADVEQELKGL